MILRYLDWVSLRNSKVGNDSKFATFVLRAFVRIEL
ncbi:MAG: hypothetical protein RL607_2111, partial [Bacteroidota bacterium]